MVHDEEEEGETHDSAHDYQEEKYGISHEEILKSKQAISLHNFAIHFKLHFIKPNPLYKGNKWSCSNMCQIQTKDGMQS